MRPIDADAKITALLYDEEHEETNSVEMTIADFLDSHTVEGCPQNGGWISVKDRLPAETHSIFYRFFGTEIWRNSMWREQSSKVLVTVVFKDVTKTVTTGETHDGIWNTTISKTLDPIVTHWMPMPEPPEEDKDDEL